VSDVVARRLVVSGLVQGVNFRWWVVQRAQARGLSGWAANLADGSVEVWLQGEAGAVAAVERLVGEGPPPARVVSVDARDESPRADLDGFSRR
jgi:acylphosphatase